MRAPNEEYMDRDRITVPVLPIMRKYPCSILLRDHITSPFLRLGVARRYTSVEFQPGILNID